MSHYIVTGSEGFIGKNLCEKLLERGDTVSGYDTKIKKDLFGVTPYVLKEADAIFHLACINQEVAEVKKRENVVVNAYAAQFLADLARDAGIPLVYTSTASVYGNAKLIPTPVGAALAPQTSYAAAKALGETFVRHSGCIYKIFRLSNVYGPHQTPDNPYCGVIGKFIENWLNGEPLKVISPGYQTRDFTYVGDVVNALISHAVPWNGTFNLGTGVETSVVELAEKISGVYDFAEPRSVDTINRRCLVSSFSLPTSLDEGLKLTLEWDGWR